MRTPPNSCAPATCARADDASVVRAHRGQLRLDQGHRPHQRAAALRDQFQSGIAHPRARLRIGQQLFQRRPQGVGAGDDFERAGLLQLGRDLGEIVQVRAGPPRWSAARSAAFPLRYEGFPIV